MALSVCLLLLVSGSAFVNAAASSVTCNDTLIAAETQFKCADNSSCFLIAAKCDLVKDCADNSDEIGCNCTSIGVGLRTCADNSCMNSSLFCDGSTFNCFDKSDESISHAHCNCTTGNDTNQCADGTCYSDAEQCNGSPQCADGTDENAENCCSRLNCTTTYDACKANSSCWAGVQSINKTLAECASNLKQTQDQMTKCWTASGNANSTGLTEFLALMDCNLCNCPETGVAKYCPECFEKKCPTEHTACAADESCKDVYQACHVTSLGEATFKTCLNTNSTWNATTVPAYVPLAENLIECSRKAGCETGSLAWIETTAVTDANTTQPEPTPKPTPAPTSSAAKLIPAALVAFLSASLFHFGKLF